MKRFTAHLLIAAAALVAVPAHAQFFGVLQGATSIFTQVTTKIGGEITGSNKAQDIEQERSKFFANVQAETAGMDSATRQQMTALMTGQWATAEDAILMRNAQAARGADAPWVDFRKVATDALGGLAMGANLGTAALGTGGLDGVLRSSAMDGLIGGIGGQPSGFNPAAAANNARMAGAMAAGLTPVGMNPLSLAAASGIGAGISNGVASAVSSASSQFGFGNAAAKAYQLTAATDPTAFFGKSGRDLLAKDLYRENGNLGYKRIEQDAAAGAEAYAPIGGDDRLKAIVYNYDPTTGQMRAAFRVLKAQALDFKPIVDAVAAKLGQQPRYAGTTGMMRAVWENGIFVAADAKQVTAGWSQMVGAAYVAAEQAQ